MVAVLTGVMCALATPLDEDRDVDIAGLDRLVERVVTGGVTGVCPVGSTGEGPRLGEKQRHTVVRRVRELAPEGVLVIPCPSTAAPMRVVDEIGAFASMGCDAVLLAPPSAYPLDDDDILAYYERVAEQSPLPIVMYNFPTFTRVAIPATIAGTLARHENIVALKDSSRDLEYAQAVLYAAGSTPNFAVLTGSDTLLLATLTVGGRGAIVASANLVPELGVAVYNATLAADWPRARAMQQTLFNIVSAARAAGFPYGWKAALELAGVCSSYPAAPASPVQGRDLAVLRARLEELKAI